MIDLDALGVDVGLSEESASVLSHRAAVALERRHEPGVHLIGTVQGRTLDEELSWRRRSPAAAAHEDINRVTEEGAEAIALALASSRCSWRVERRLQSRLSEGADGLLVGPSGLRLVLEVGGTDEQDLAKLLARKIEQVKRSPFATRGTPSVCVVRFLEPSAILWSNDGPERAE
jgi:hypothetical protein